jgi:hypothetical protein
MVGITFKCRAWMYGQGCFTPLTHQLLAHAIAGTLTA